MRDAEPVSAVRRIALEIALPLFVAVFALFQVLPDIAAEQLHGDENLWIGQSARYTGLVLDGDIDHPLWWDWNALDQPPAGRYFIGAAMILAGHGARLPELADIPEWDFERDDEWNLANGGRPPQDVLLSVRRSNAFLGAASCVLLYLLGRMLFGRLIGLGAGLLLPLSPALQFCSRRAMSDAPLLFATMLAIGLIALFAKGVLDGDSRKATVATVLAGIAIGLSTAVKFNGALTGFVLLLTGLWIAFCSRRRRETSTALAAKKVVQLTALGVVVSLAFFIAINPTLYRQPGKQIRRILAQRADTVLALQEAPGVVHSAGERVHHVARRTLLGSEESYAMIGPAVGLPVELVLVAVGLVLLALGEVRSMRRDHRPTAGAVVIVWTATFFLVITVWLPHDWGRYYMPLMPCVALLSSLALVRLGGAVRTVAHPSPAALPDPA